MRCCCKRYVDDPRKATDAQIDQAAWDTVPHVPPLFWSLPHHGRARLLLHRAVRRHVLPRAPRRQLDRCRWLLRLALLLLPLPWIAAELGWFVAEFGRQPWIIEGVLPTFLGRLRCSAQQRVAQPRRLHRVLLRAAVVEVYLMVKYVRLGPAETEKCPTAPPEGAAGAVSSPARRCTRVRDRRSDRHDVPIDYEILRLIWWVLLGVLLIGFAVMDGFDLGVAHAAALRRPDRHRAPRR